MRLVNPFSTPARPDFDFLNDRENFLPFRIDVLLERMLRDPRLKPEDHQPLRDLRRLLGDRFHYEYHALLEALKTDFVPFDPDRETEAEPTFTPERLREIQDRLLASVRQALTVANYRLLEPEEMARCLELQPVGGLSVHVDTEDFEAFDVYYRGIRERDEEETLFFFWKRKRPIIHLKRVFVVARFKEDLSREDEEFGGRILIKMFKDVPVENIKIIAPKVKLGMPIFDRLKIGGTVLGSAATTLYKLVVAVTLSPILFAIVLGGLLFAAFKGIMSFMNSKTKYLHVFSSSLYYRNLSNNRAALATLVDAAEEQEVKEALLGYFVLFLEGRSMTMRELDDAVERWIEEQFHHRIDFEVDDAIRKLTEKELAIRSHRIPTDIDIDRSEEMFDALPLPETLRRLDAAWDHFNRFE